MDDNVVHLGDFAIKRKDSKFAYPKTCQHLNLTLDDHGQTVKCDDCGDQVSAYWAITSMAAHVDREWKKINSAFEKLKKDQQSAIHLTAARKVEAAWRKRDMLPCCPHCGEGIAPEDGFGGSMINKRFHKSLRKPTKPACTEVKS